MNKKIFMLSALLVLISLAVFVYARVEGENLNGSVQLKRGWNLVTIYAIRNAFEEDNWRYFDGKDIKAAFFYDRYNQRYIRIYPNREGEKLNEWLAQLGHREEGNIYEWGGYLNSAMWLYSNKDQTIDFRTLDGPLFPEHVGLRAGWNFLAVTPEMIDRSLNDVKGNCNIVSAYLWDKTQQQWGTILNLLDDKNILNDEGGIWGGFIVKVLDDCTLGEVAEEITTPPELP
jgi:hypothetical protein